MKQNLIPKIACVALMTIFLAACGGGGGTAKEDSNVILDGNASKGALFGADVKVYEIVDGVKSSTVWAIGKTDNNGAFTLNGTPTPNPVIVEVTVNSETLMLDETQIESDGSFKKIQAPIDLKMRSFASSVSEKTTVQINAITEAALAIAYSSLQPNQKMSLQILTAAKQFAIQMSPPGTVPFFDKPALKATEMSPEQTKFSAMMAGLMMSSDNSCNLQCQVGNLSKNIVINVAPDGKGTISPDSALAIKNKRTDLLTVGQSVWLDNLENKNNLGVKLNQVSTSLASTIGSSKTTEVPLTSKTFFEYTNSVGLEGFITAMRDGFRVTENNITAASEQLDIKYKNISLLGSRDIISAIDRVKMDCFEGKLIFNCSKSINSSVVWTKDGESWVGRASNNDGSSWEGTVTGTIEGGKITANLNANKKSLTGNILTSVENLKIVTNQTSSVTSGDFLINGVIRAYDVNNSMFSLAFKDWAGTISQSSVTPQKISFNGGITLTGNNGDVLTGNVSLKGNRTEIVRNYNYYCGNNLNPCTYQWTERDESFENFSIQLAAVNNNSQLLKLDVFGTQQERNRFEPLSASNYDTYSGEFSVNFTDSLSLKISGAQSNWDAETVSATISSGGSDLKIDGIFTIAEASSGNLANKWCAQGLRCASSLELRSGDGAYTLTLTRLNGKPQGDIYKGLNKVGEVKNGIIQVNGRDVSIY